VTRTWQQIFVYERNEIAKWRVAIRQWEINPRLSVNESKETAKTLSQHQDDGGYKHLELIQTPVRIFLEFRLIISTPASTSMVPAICIADMGSCKKTYAKPIVATGPTEPINELLPEPIRRMA
jgi:hypothetical protein